MIVNLTPHPLNLFLKDGTEKTIQPNGIIARCKTVQTPIGDIDGVPVYKTTYGEVEGLPPKSEDKIYIVSALVAQAVKERDDVLIPTDYVRDEQGRIKGCKGFAHV